MRVIDDLKIPNVKAYKTRGSQHNSEIQSWNESSIPPLQNHVFFIKFYLRLQWQNRLAKCAICDNTPGSAV